MVPRVRTRLTFAAFVLTAVLWLPACGGRDAEPDEVDGIELFSRAADRMETVGSFAFLLEHENGTTTIANGLAMVRAEGRIGGPESMEAELRALAGPVNVVVSVIVLPQGSWMTNPLTGQWMPQEMTVSQFFDPATGVPALMRRISDAGVVGTATFGAASAYEVDATVPSESLAGLVPRAAGGRAVRVRAWIGVDDPVLHRLEIVGAVQEGEAENLVRRLSLSEFGSDFTIVPPS
jgi:hypothetical protein